jgi:hypothetical protein
LVLGLTVNWLSDAYKAAMAPAVAGVILLVVVGVALLHRLPPQAPIQRLVSRTGLGSAAVVTVASLLIAGPWRPWLVLIATALALVACLTPIPGKVIPVQLAAVAMIGVGVAVIGLGVSWLLESGLLGCLAVIGFGVAVIGLGVSWLLESELLLGLAVIGFGVAVIGPGVSWLLESELLLGLAAIGVGVAAIGVGVAAIGVGVAVIGADVGLIGLGVAVVRSGSQVTNRLRPLIPSPAQQPRNESGPDTEG